VILTNILYRTFFIKALEYGTAFTIDVSGHEYLITARHLLPPDGKTVDVKIFRDKAWTTLAAEVVGRCRGEIDIAVLRVVPRLTSLEFSVTASMADITLGHDVYFLGFPYKMSGDIGSFMGGLPCPFAKKGTLSLLTPGSPQLLYVDAINNEGFSGGPLFFYPQGKPLELRIAAVVSKFKVEFEAVLDERGEATQMRVPYNTGFLVAYGIKHAIDLINSNTDA
jgi:S1-C subfamily serine protease